MSELPDSVPEVKPTEQIAPESAPPEPVETTPPPPEAPPVEKPKALKKAPVRKAVNYTFVTVFSAFRSLILTFAAAVIVSTIFMWFTTPDFLSARTRQDLALVRATAASSTIVPSTSLPPVQYHTKRIGILAGHSGVATEGRTRGNVDPGTVCSDGFTEASVTMNVARQVVISLQGRGYSVDLLEEFDPRLYGYEADVFLSMHADACENLNDGFSHSGFKNIYPSARFTVRDQDVRLNDCLRTAYGANTGIPFTPTVITEDMKFYHVWSLLAPTTPASIIELGNLYYDRDLLEHQTVKAAAGIVSGLLCYLQPAQPPTSQPSTPAATSANGLVPTPTP